MTASQNNNRQFAGVWEMKGDELILNGVLIAKFHPIAPDRVRQQILEFCKLGTQLEVQHHERRSPRLFVTVDADRLNAVTSVTETICTIEVTHTADDKIARFHLGVGVHDDGSVHGEMRMPRRNTDVVRAVAGAFVDWSK